LKIRSSSGTTSCADALGIADGTIAPMSERTCADPTTWR
jgi:hypothetical protein